MYIARFISSPSRRLAACLALTASFIAQAQNTGPSSSATPYILPVQPNVTTYSVLSVGNTPAGSSYQMVGIPDGLGAYDNGNGTFTVLMNHELGNTSGVVRDHGARGAFISEYVIDKASLTVISGGDLIQNVFNWNNATQSSSTVDTAIAFNRFCSADLAPVSAFSFGNLGTTSRLYLTGEEGGSTGYATATVATGADKGNTYILGKLNLSTNGSGLTGVGGWENLLANPTSQLKTVVIGNNDGGSGLMSNTLAVYVGTKTSTGTEADKAGLTNGTTKFVNLAGITSEIANGTLRTTAIVSGTPFTLSSSTATAFSRPEDGAWNPLNLSQYYFVTTDQLDQVSDGVGTQIGRTRLWRLNFTDISNPDLGGTIDLLLTGTGLNGNMFDNLTVTWDGRLILQEDVGGSAHNSKLWMFDPATSALTQLAMHDPARFGNIGLAATAPFTNDEESSGVIDISSIMNDGNTWLLTSDQAHYTSGISAANVEGGQLLAIRIAADPVAVPEPSTYGLLAGLGLLGFVVLRRHTRRR